MRISQVKEVVRHCVSTQSPVMIHSAPGLGKSDLVRQIVADKNALTPKAKGKAKQEVYGLVDFRLALRDPTDIKGFPMPDQATSTMKFFRDGELPKDGNGILFLDEINSAAPSTQAAAMQLTLDRKIGDYRLPDGWSIVAAGNRETDRSVVNRMPSALSLRLQHVDLEVSLDDSCEWAFANGISPEMIAFWRFKPDLLHKFDATLRSSPNPRSWARANKDLDAPISKEARFELLKGTVGEVAALDFTAFRQIWHNLPSLDQIMLNPKDTPVPKEPGTLYALATAIGLRANGGNMNKLMMYVTRMPVEFQVLTVRDIVRTSSDAITTTSYVEWCVNNSHIL